MKEWIFLFLGLILAYSLEFTRPWVKSFFEKSSLSFRERRLYIIRSRYRKIKELRSDPLKLQIWGLKLLAGGFIGLIAIGSYFTYFTILAARRVLSDVYYDTGHLGSFFLTFEFVLLVFRDKNMLDDMSRFSSYQQKIIEKIKKLGGNPEDLDKDEENRDEIIETPKKKQHRR